MFVVSFTAAAASARNGHRFDKDIDKGMHWRHGHYKQYQGGHYEKDYNMGYKDGIKDGFEGNDIDFQKETKGYIDGYKDGYNDGKQMASDSDNGDDSDSGDGGDNSS